ncbi:chemotaxis protein CheW [Alkalibacterium sp.]|nr:MAG: hypothetical protein EA249_09070 [Alkalibacterium sp.]
MAQHLLFKAGGQTFGLPISETDKIVALENHTAIPGVSSYIVGLQEVEGDVLAIIDLADRFYNLPESDYEEADIILVNWKETRIGLLVNEVTVVENYATEQLAEAVEEKVDGLSLSYISAFVQTEEEIIPILDSHYLFAEEKGEELRKLVEIQTIKA